MMESNYITDLPSPPEQDFKFLKERGLDFVRANGGPRWSNLNSADPGITILDQLCYALSELGYCTGFPIPDLLTGMDEKININDQFFKPAQILTTSPITIEDYIKYLVDEEAAVTNAIINPTMQNGVKVYQVYLLISDKSMAKDSAEQICRRAYYTLNKARNIGEIFLMPVALVRIQVFVTGVLMLHDKNNIASLIKALDAAFSEYVFPSIRGKGSDELYAAGSVTENILNGPSLKNGWVDNIGIKKDQLSVIEVAHVVNGFSSIVGMEPSHLKRSGDKNFYDELRVEIDQLIDIDISGSVQQGFLTVQCNEITLTTKEVDALVQQTMQQSFSTQPGIHPAVLNEKLDGLPASTYRDISGYYSIQNTFPEIFAAGPDAVMSNAAAYKVAQSRQLKGYLTIFDQVLANQFAQLGNVNKLFSFHNATTSSPSDTTIFYAKQNKAEEYRGIYPVPYRTFSPTYFYQSLYDVPHIRSLLKDNHVFDHSAIGVTPEEEELKSWEAYKLDPYNAYIRGLMDLIDDDEDNLQRRNEMLDHLLARHGESPEFINTVIEGTEYSGSNARDSVIIKSLLLQHLALLSYNRSRGVNYFTADRIKRKLPAMRAYGDHGSADLDDKDFIDLSGQSAKANRITPADLINFSPTELRISILFG
jgi:hypothetical protein